jgi:hypothetical protein
MNGKSNLLKKSTTLQRLSGWIFDKLKTISKKVTIWVQVVMPIIYSYYVPNSLTNIFGDGDQYCNFFRHL